MILVVVNGDATEPIVYSQEIARRDSTYLYRSAIRNAVDELALDMYPSEIEEACQELLHGRVYWLNETYGFTTLPY